MITRPSCCATSVSNSASLICFTGIAIPFPGTRPCPCYPILIASPQRCHPLPLAARRYNSGGLLNPLPSGPSLTQEMPVPLAPQTTQSSLQGVFGFPITPFHTDGTLNL